MTTASSKPHGTAWDQRNEERWKEAVDVAQAFWTDQGLPRLRGAIPPRLLKVFETVCLRFYRQLEAA